MADLGADQLINDMDAVKNSETGITNKVESVLNKLLRSTLNVLGLAAKSDDVTEYPIGGVAPFASTAIPDNFIECDGRVLERKGEFAKLFAVIGTEWGSTSSSNFAVPDCRRRQIIGISESDELGGYSGVEKRVMNLEEMPVHRHGKGTLEVEDANIHEHNITPGRGVGGRTGTGTSNQYFGSQSAEGFDGGRTSTAGAHPHRIVGSSEFEGESADISIMAPSLVVVQAIRAK